jgi:hypothetical protein
MTKLLRGLKIGIWNLEFIRDLEFGTWNFLALQINPKLQ